MKIFIQACLMIGLCSNPALANDEALHHWLQTTVEQHKMAGLTAVVVRDGKTIFNRAYGVADINSGAPVSTQHLYHMASVSKPVVAVAVMQLVEQGKINLSAPVSTYLPYFTMADDRVKDVTIDQLLSHTSGMPDVEDYAWKAPETDAQALERWVKAQSGKKLLFTPGTDRRYSNIGYEILGDIVAKVSGLPFEDYIKKHIFEPLGMKQSSFLRSDIPSHLRVKAHVGISETIALDYYPYNRRHAPSSTFHTNGDELAKWLIAFSFPKRLSTTGILQPETVNAMWQIQFRMSDKRHMTRGWSRAVTDDSGTLLRHGGSDEGFRTEMAVFEDKDAGYGLMSNKEQLPLAEIQKALRYHALDKPLPAIPGLSAGQKTVSLFKKEGALAVVINFGKAISSGTKTEADAIYFFSQDLLRNGDRVNAEIMADGMVKHLPNHHLIQAFKANVKFELGKISEAEQAARKALDMQADIASMKELLTQISKQKNR